MNNDQRNIQQPEVEILRRAVLLDSLAERFPKISGRGVKNMLKLVRVVAARHKRKPSLEMFEAIAKFQDVGEDAA